ncbi:hypothetical protein [Streptococcus parauberis]|uniref:hypothetical protein n=1 Tax=Streptococcus parauberis TaxID=1348 RepID=UPI000CCF0DE0|nr:hypothetical protein [Streptococcus parauberis]PNY19852.1 hypothetical protein ASN86_00515 [Streptococcus parauberis]
MGLLDKQIEELRKELEKALIEGLGVKAIAISYSNKTKIKVKESEIVEDAKSFMTTNASSMEEAVKGKFGTKIKESLESQKNLLNDL